MSALCYIVGRHGVSKCVRGHRTDVTQGHCSLSDVICYSLFVTTVTLNKQIFEPGVDDGLFCPTLKCATIRQKRFTHKA